MTTVTCDETMHETYNVPVGQCFLHTSVNVPNFVDIHNNALICLGGSNKKEEPSKISDLKKRLLVVPGEPTITFSQGNQNLCIISSLESAFYYMGDELTSEYIIRRKQQSLSLIHNKGRMQLCRDILMRQHREKNEIKIHYHIQEWHKFTTYDIFYNQ